MIDIRLWRDYGNLWSDCFKQDDRSFSGMTSHGGDGSGEVEVEGIEVVLETMVWDDGGDGSKYSRDASHTRSGSGEDRSYADDCGRKK